MLGQNPFQPQPVNTLLMFKILKIRRSETLDVNFVNQNKRDQREIYLRYTFSEKSQELR